MPAQVNDAIMNEDHDNIDDDYVIAMSMGSYKVYKCVCFPPDQWATGAHTCHNPARPTNLNVTTNLTTYSLDHWTGSQTCPLECEIRTIAPIKIRL